MLKVLVFDLDETLISSKGAILDFFRGLYEELGLAFPESEAELFYTAPEAGFLERLFPDPALLRAARAFKANYGRERYLDKITPKPRALETLAALSPHYRLAVATNRGVSTNRVLERLGFAPHFSLVLHAASLDFAKPHASVMQRIYTYFGATAAETLLIGDSQVDVETARNGGARVAIVAPPLAPGEAAPKPSEFYPARGADFYLAGLGEVPALVSRL